MHSHFRSENHQRVSGVVSCVTEIAQSDSLGTTEMFANGQKIGKHLRRMKFVGQAVPDRNLGVLREFFNDVLSEAAVFDAVKHGGKNSRGIRDRLFLSDLGARRIKVSRSHAEIVRADFKCASGARACFLENQGNILPAQAVNSNSLFLLILEICGKIYKILYLLCRKIKKFQKISAFQIYAHAVPPVICENYAVPF